MRLSLPRKFAAWTCLLSLPVAGLISIHMKQDDSWDFQNYHLYNAFSLLTGRLGRDFWSGSLQIYFNPLLDLPYYLLSRVWLPGSPRLVAFLAGFPYGAAVAVVACVNLFLFSGDGYRGLILVLTATLVSVTGTTAVSEIGTTHGDIAVTVPILLALFALLASKKQGSRWLLACGCAGLLAGVAAGLKLTMGIYAPAFVFTVLVCAPKSARLRGASVFCLTWLLCFSALYGWWAVCLQQHFGSPLFPMFNGLFASPWTTRASTLDDRFFPRSFMQAMFYPFFWMSGRPFLVTEEPMRDARFALAYLSIILVLWRAWAGRLKAQLELTCLVVFWVSAFVAWETAFSILRYAMPLELLSGTLIAYTLRPLCSAADVRITVAVSAILFVAIMVTEKPRDLGRLKHYGRTTGDFAAPPLQDHSVVAVIGHPMSFVAPFISRPDTVFVGLSGPGETVRTSRAIRDRLGAASAIYVVVGFDGARSSATLSAHGISVQQDKCSPLNNPFQAGIVICPARLEASR